MKKEALITIVAIIVGSLLLQCGRIKKTDAEVEREQWITGFSDSIDYYKNQSEKIEKQLNLNNSEISGLLENFEHINNPKEVTGYYLLKGWQKKIPLTTTGIYARINEDEKLELIATLQGNTFNRIEVSYNNETFESETVPHDQAFNFRHQRYNTVYFTGGKADTISQFISSHKNDKIILNFIEGNKRKSFQIPVDEKNMINETFELYSLQKETKALQKEMWVNSKKIETFRRMMDSELNKSDGK